MNIIRKEYSFPSKSGIADIFARCLYPENEVKAIFQISHGMAEHGERYADFANYLCKKGFAVAVEDHVGHGKSVKNDDCLGYFGENNGWDVLVEDEKQLTELIKAEYPDISDDYKAYLLTRYEQTYYPAGVLGAGKAVYIERNYEMINKSRYCIFYYDEKCAPTARKSGCKLALEYAHKQHKEIMVFSHSTL